MPVAGWVTAAAGAPPGTVVDGEVVGAVGPSSREHAVIVQKEGRLYLRDNASTAGTFLNWKRLQAGEELLLRHNDIVSFGEIVYEFRAQGEDEATEAG